jgi:hypothetical protein
MDLVTDHIFMENVQFYHVPKHRDHLAGKVTHHQIQVWLDWLNIGNLFK